MFRQALAVVIALAATPCFAQQGAGNECTPAGVWYGGSLTAYQMTVTPVLPAGHYAVSSAGMYKTSALNTLINGELVKQGDRYEGSIMALTGDDHFLLPPAQFVKMPDLTVGWISMRLNDCNSITITVPFFGIYFGPTMWAPNVLGATFTDKVPLVDPPDIDMLDVLTGGFPIVENYRRVPNGVNPLLLHQ